MRKLLLSALLLFVLSGATIYCQTVQTLNKTGSTEILLNDRVDGIGPGGNSSVYFGSNDMLDSLTLIGYPKLKNLPDSLTNLKVYTMITKREQFWYQKYRNGFISKAEFVDYFNKQKIMLADTSRLTPKMVRNYFSVAAGYDKSNQPKYVIDTNGNDDFSDDTLYTLVRDYNTQVDKLAKSVSIEYFDGKNIMQENILCTLSPGFSNKSDKLEVLFSFPQYRYAKVMFEGKTFFICANENAARSTIYFLPDKPNFQPLTMDNEIRLHQYLTVGNADFLYEPISQNMDKIRLTRAQSPVGKKNTAANAVDSKPIAINVSAQVGKFAPEIKGVDVQNGSMMSLNALKGKYVFLDFWGTHCGPCIQEFPYIRKVYDTFSSNEVVILGVVEDDYNGKIKKFLEDKQVTWPTIVKTHATTQAKDYVIPSFPTSFLIGPDGKIITTNLRGDALYVQLEKLKVKKK